MSSIYNSYMTESERSEAIVSATEDVQFSKLFNMYEGVLQEKELNLKMAELKVMQESGTTEDLEYLYEAVNEEAEKKSSGILSSIFKAIKMIWQGIGNSISNFLSKFKSDGNSDPEISVSASDEEAVSKLDTVMSHFKKIINAIKTKQFAVIATSVAAITGAVVFFTRKNKEDGSEKKVKLSVVKGWLDKFKKSSDTASTACDSLANDASAADPKVNAGITAIRTISNAIKSFASYLMGKISGAGKFVKDTVTGERKKQKTFENYKNGKKEAADEAEKAQSEQLRNKRANEAKTSMTSDAKKTAEEANAKAGGLLSSKKNKEAAREATDKYNKTADEVNSKSGNAIKYKNGDLSYVDNKGTKYRQVKNSNGSKEWQKKDGKDGKWYVMGTNVTPPGFKKSDVLVHESEECPWDDADVVVTESTETTIFGYSLEDEALLQESEMCEAEIDELIAAFEGM